VKKREEFIKSIFSIASPLEFNDLSLEIFRFQYAKIPVYKEYVDHVVKDISQIKKISQIPFLPISFFKSHLVSSEKSPLIFRSSGTTGQSRSEHHILNPEVYIKSFTKHFYETYPEAKNHIIIALLPSYLERADSSLIYMVNHLIKENKMAESGFYLNASDELISIIEKSNTQNKKVILFGVTFALLDLVEDNGNQKWPHVTVIETGGMKGRGKEMTRNELHTFLKTSLGTPNIHSEYGMTELLSQAYTEDEWFTPSSWMKVLIRDADDPFSIHSKHKRGGINIIDLANLDSCAFLATEDLGEIHVSGKFKVLGRFDQSEIRGCNLMVTDL